MATTNGALSRKEYDKALRGLQVELCALQDWIRQEGERWLSCSRAATRPARAA
jgi:polyphosphate kinase 2 (PPK2 family)